MAIALWSLLDGQLKPSACWSCAVTERADRPGQSPARCRNQAEERRFEIVGRLAADMMEVARLVPVLPVSLIAAVRPETECMIDEFELELEVRAVNLTRLFETNDARLHVPRGDRDYAMHVGLRVLARRSLAEKREGLYAMVEAERPLLAYDANSVAHLRRRC